MVIEGKLHQVFDTVSVSDKFQRRQFVVEYADNPMYPQYVSFELTQNRVSDIDQCQVGDMIEVTFNLRGREWVSPQLEKKYFNTLEAWQIKKVEGQAASNGSRSVEQIAAQTSLPGEHAMVSDDEEDQGLPF